MTDRLMPRRNSDAVWRLADEKAPEFFGLSDRIWDHPEVNFQEEYAAREHEAALEREGFRVTSGVAADLLANPALRGAAAEAFQAFRADHPFENPIISGMEPPLDMAAR